ncbi:MAG: exodeoxyribonuclease VII small subunit [Lachnospirales bacterium]
MATKKNFEDSLSRLEEIVNEIEDNSIGLDKSLKLYTEGVELAAYCAKQLKGAEQKVTLLKEKYEGVFEQKNFDLSEE